MISSYEVVSNKEVEIRDSLNSFPDTLKFNTICEVLSDKVNILNSDWTTVGATQNISNLKKAIEELDAIMIELTSYVDNLKKNTVEGTGYKQIIESQVYKS